MTDLQDFPADYLSQRLADRRVADPELIPFLDECLRKWAGVSYRKATVGDMMRASRNAAADAARRSPRIGAAMAGRSEYTAADVLRTMRERNAR